MIIIYKSVFDGITDDITDVLSKYGVKFEREKTFNDNEQIHETILTIRCKNDIQKNAVKHLLIAFNQLAI